MFNIEKRMMAYLDDKDVITVYLSGNYYNGESSIFRLRDNRSGELSDLVMISNYFARESNYKIYKLSTNDVKIGGEYDIIDQWGLTTSLVYGNIVRSDWFDQMYYYDGDDLGYRYTKTKTTFKVWAPVATKVKVEYVMNDTSKTIRMVRGDKGVWSCEIEEDLEGATYTYLVRNNDMWAQTVDPYGLSSTANNKRSVVIDPEKIKMNANKDKLKPMDSYTDAIIYEMSVRDFTSSEYSGANHRGKFLGMIEEGLKTPNGNPIGLDYLLELGISHVQLMPIYDFATVDEINEWAYYNWGYDPMQYNVPEGSYSTDVFDPYRRVIELKEAIAKLHEKGIRVNMDVVYNHLYDRDQSAFEKIVPGYYFRLGPNGEISNGSFCGNDFDSKRLMARKYIIDSCKYWMNEYGIDGFRFDLMGIIDIKTMNEVFTACHQIDENVMIYGEGWNMPTILDLQEKSMSDNYQNLPNIGFFNDRYRDIIKGKSSKEEILAKGYGTGDTYQTQLAIDMITCRHFVEDPNQSINYVECHDNATLWDKMKGSNKEESKEIRLQRQKLINGILAISQGVMFIHGGQEFCRTKYGEHNTYNANDSINQFDWIRKDRYLDEVNYMKDMIHLRNKWSVFRFKTRAEIDQYVSTRIIDYRVIQYSIKDVKEYLHEYNDVEVFINPTHLKYDQPLNGSYQLIADERGLIKEQQFLENMTIQPYSMVIVAK